MRDDRADLQTRRIRACRSRLKWNKRDWAPTMCCGAARLPHGSRGARHRSTRHGTRLEKGGGCASQRYREPVLEARMPGDGGDAIRELKWTMRNQALHTTPRNPK